MIKLILIAVTLVYGVTSRRIVKTITAAGSTGWGGWGEVQFCPQGSYAAGFRIKVNLILPGK